MDTFAGRLKTARLRAALTQEEVAERSGVPVVTLSRLENGASTRRGPRITTVRRLAEALDTDPGWLMLGDEAEKVGKDAA